MTNEYPKLAVSRSVSLYLGHIAQIVDLATRWNVKESKIVQEALDEYFERHSAEETMPIRQTVEQ